MQTRFASLIRPDGATLFLLQQSCYNLFWSKFKDYVVNHLNFIDRDIKILKLQEEVRKLRMFKSTFQYSGEIKLRDRKIKHLEEQIRASKECSKYARTHKPGKSWVTAPLALGHRFKKDLRYSVAHEMGEFNLLDQEYNCHLCRKGFKKLKTLQQHRWLFHKDGNPIPTARVENCPKCNKPFNYWAWLKHKKKCKAGQALENPENPKWYPSALHN